VAEGFSIGAIDDVEKPLRLACRIIAIAVVDHYRKLASHHSRVHRAA